MGRGFAFRESTGYMIGTQNPSKGYFEGQRSDVAELVPDRCSRVLDVGCGYGGLGRSLVARGKVQVFGVEINPAASPNLQGVYTAHWIADVEQFSLPSNIEDFDCIIFADVLEHLRDPWGTLSRYLQWLKPGGYVVASIPNVRNIALLYNLIVRGRWRYEDSGLLDRTHIRFFTRKEIMGLFSTAGLYVELVKENREHLSIWRRVFSAPLLFMIPDLGVCQYVVRARHP
jgi:2-polyprenyl-3-methyl-5-hydroxy-6-metoxy-1,4-benzoquinol methylase